MSNPSQPSRELTELLTVEFELMMERFLTSRLPGVDLAIEIHPAEMHVLAVLGRKGPTPMSTLAEALGLPPSTATHRVDALIKKGLATRERSSTDRRVVEVALSEMGQSLSAKMHATRVAMSGVMLAPLSPGERALFVELIRKVNAQPKS